MTPPGKISLLLADVDGTLVTNEKILTERACNAVHRLQDAGMRFAITSGRPPKGMAMLIEPLKLDTPIAGFNGGLFVHPDLTIIEERELAPDVAKQAVDLILKHGLDAWVYSGNHWLVRDPEAPHVDREAWTVKFRPKVVKDFGTALEKAVKIVGVSDDLDRVKRCESDAQAALGHRATAARSQPYYLDITHPDANKGFVAAYLSRTLGIPEDEIATIGDQPNDVLMFKRSGFSIAMGNASGEVKQQASAVTDSYENEGFAKAVERFLLGPYGGHTMTPTRVLHNLGQSLWLDNITRNMLTAGTLSRYIRDFSVTGLTSNPTIFDHAIKNSPDYDASIRDKLRQGKSGEELFLDLALEDITAAADLFRPIHGRTSGVDGWVSLEVSPLLAHDTKATITVAKNLHARAKHPNVLIKIPGTKEGLPAIEEAIFAGVPVNVTLLFSREQYLAAAEAYVRGIERRIEIGLDPQVNSVASVFVSRWDAAVMDKVPEALRGQLGIAIAKRIYKAYCTQLTSPRWMRIYNSGARPQRLLWASTGTKDPKASDVLYIKALAAPFTVNTMPEATLKAFADHGEARAILPADGGNAEEVLAQFAGAGVDCDALAAKLQDEGAKSFVKSWNDLLNVIASKSAVLEKAG